MKLGQSVVPYAPNSQKRVTHSTIKVLHQPTSSECVTIFPCSLPRAFPNDNEGKLQKFAMLQLGKPFYGTPGRYFKKCCVCFWSFFGVFGDFGGIFTMTMQISHHF